jgi:hypothetical protein
MNTVLLSENFGRMGARVKVGAVGRSFRDRPGLDIGSDERGEFFDIRLGPAERVEYEVVDLRPDLRHLLLLARREGAKEKYLCGHDERHWFVCAVPGQSVSTVTNAMEALQPVEVRRAVARDVRRVKNRLRRRNEAFVRQGEWFFMPVPAWFRVDDRMVFRNEPISRGAGSKPHMCQYLVRTGGETVMVSRHRPDGVTLAEHRNLLARNAKASKWDWRPMRRNVNVFVRGRVWHPDHKTVVLDDWHHVVMNTEGKAPWAPAVVFLD